jgi:hypothetical protein
MQHRIWFRQAKSTSRARFLTAILFCLSVVGCSNYCFVFVSNPGGSISTSSNTPSCQLNSSTGTVGLHVTAAPTPTRQETPAPAAIRHIFVTLRGIEATPSVIPNDDSPDWRELAPKLATQPVQLDLLAQNNDLCNRKQNTFGDVAIPADAYHQIRLRLAPNQPATDEPVPEGNACGSAGLNCVVTSDGGILPLLVNGPSSQFQISSDHISGGFFRVLPDTTVNLEIQFNPQSTLVFSTDDPVRLVPVFTAEPQAPCQSTATPN